MNRLEMPVKRDMVLLSWIQVFTVLRLFTVKVAVDPG